MTYDFTLEKKGLVSVLASGTLIALLLFIAGWIVGMNWTMNGSRVLAARSENASPSEKEQSGPKEPVLADETLSPEIAAPGKAAGTATDEPVQPGEVAGAPKQPGVTPDASPLNNDVAAAPVADAQEKIVEEATLEPPPAALVIGNAGMNSGGFTVQVGVFVEQNEANRLFKQIERKGYAPSFFADRDAENRQWYAVRIGAYSDKDQAANAAVNFTKQEKIKAVVRPLGSL